MTETLPNTGLVKYYEVDITKIPGAQHIISNKTKEVFTGVFGLYYKTCDAEGKPLSKPLMDYPKNYTIIFENGYLPLEEFVKNNAPKKYYAIISNHTIISGIENFYIYPAENFYSIEINEKVKDFLDLTDPDNFEIHEDLYNWRLEDIQVRSGYELLFFIESNNRTIQEELNTRRFNVLEINVKTYTKAASERGVLYPLDNYGMCNFTFTFKDRLEMDKTLLYELEVLWNNGNNYIIEPQYIESARDKLENNAEDYEIYSEAYLTYLKKLLKGTQRLDEIPKEEAEIGNPFIYGYMNKSISNALSRR